MTDRQSYEALYGDLVNWVEHYKVLSDAYLLNKQFDNIEIAIAGMKITNDKFMELL